MSPHLALHFLGSPRLYLDDQPILVERRKAVALLTYLALEQGQHRRASLSALLWPDYDQSKAFTNLRHTLWEIQQSIGEGWLITDREKIELKQAGSPSTHPSEAGQVWLDVGQFRALLAQSRAHNQTQLQVALLVEATGLYRDHFMTGFSLKDAPNFNEWAFAESEDLRCELAGALISLSEAYCTLGQPEKAIPHARRLITLDPLNEAAHRRLMEVYLQAGQHSAALKQYQTCEEILRKELNLDPGPETYALYKQIRKRELKPAQIEKPNLVIAPKLELPAQISTSTIRKKEWDPLEIRNKSEHDPATDLYLPDAWIRWMVLTAEDTIGKLGTRVVLRKAGLAHLIGNYPSYEQPRPSKKFTFGDFATLNAELIDFCGRDGESQMRDMGHRAVRYSVTEQGALYGIGTITFQRFMSFPAQLKLSMEVILEGVRKASQSIGQDHRVFLEDRGDKLLYIVQDCVFCAGKESNRPMCMYLTGQLQGGLYWLTGETIHVEEVECRALGASACIWEIHKQPKS
jgi:DNA-binding SARP family transcriptional activator/predicted hydrocarbon binding protein